MFSRTSELFQNFLSQLRPLDCSGIVQSGIFLCTVDVACLLRRLDFSLQEKKMCCGMSGSWRCLPLHKKAFFSLLKSHLHAYVKEPSNINILCKNTLLVHCTVCETVEIFNIWVAENVSLLIVFFRFNNLFCLSSDTAF